MNYPYASANTHCVMKACDKLGISYSVLDVFGNFIQIDNTNPPKYFINAKTPFNNDAVRFICQDKAFSYSFLRDEIKMPKTIAYFDPHNVQKQFATFNSPEAILENVEKEFQYPVIVKMNNGFAGRNVFLCKDSSAVLAALKKIFNKKLQDYDYIALVQSYLEKEIEYRALVFSGEVLIVYQKDSGAILNLGEGIGKEVKDFILASKKMRAFEFTGLDILSTKDKELFLIEVNTFPTIESLTQYNGDEQAVEMYEKMLKYLLKRGSTS